jgi:hypothetical protein
MGRLSEYIYDYSLSVSKLYNQYFSSGSIQSRYYDPKVAKLCYNIIQIELFIHCLNKMKQ